MIFFYPGPSKVYDEIPAYVKQAHTLGILSMNHRSPEFVALIKKTVALLKSRLEIPKNYKVYFTSSATECWEVIAQSAVINKSIHLYNCAFGEKWYATTKPLVKKTQAIIFDREQELDPNELMFKDGDTICVTQNETSNGTQVSNQLIQKIKRSNPRHILAVDATSSLAGIYLNFKAADIWFASVQKCFGLPAGLAIMIVSPNGVKRINELNEDTHYNSLIRMEKMMNVWQTTHTPHVLGIFLLMKVLEKTKAIQGVEQQTTKRFNNWQTFFSQSKKLLFLVESKKVRSHTVIAIRAKPSLVKKVKHESKLKGLLLGDGYGSLKKETFRIANFPAINSREIKLLQNFLLMYL